jgi:hypothetical protein
MHLVNFRIGVVTTNYEKFFKFRTKFDYLSAFPAGQLKRLAFQNF